VPPHETSSSDSTSIPSHLEKDISSVVSQPFAECCEYYRILLLEACINYLLTKWDDVVKVVDADKDRAAATGILLNVPETVSVGDLHRVLEAFGKHGCEERVSALWNLMDHVVDGLLNQIEMEEVVKMSIQPVEDALTAFVKDCVHVWPLRCPPPNLPITGSHREDEIMMHDNERNKGRYRKWKDQRNEKKAQEIFLKLLKKTIKRHFEIDVEVAHRLRCCYAWAEKEHQGGKVTSILVDNSNDTMEGENGNASSNAGDSGGRGFFASGRKRYVELDPKISYQEFREVQKDIFQHLDRVSEELCNGF
jgi:hypothetical protein